MALIRRNTSCEGIEINPLHDKRRHDKRSGVHDQDSGCLRAVIFALVEVRLATATLFETAFSLASPAMTPSRFFITR